MLSLGQGQCLGQVGGRTSPSTLPLGSHSLGLLGPMILYQDSSLVFPSARVRWLCHSGVLSCGFVGPGGTGLDWNLMTSGSQDLSFLRACDFSP